MKLKYILIVLSLFMLFYNHQASCHELSNIDESVIKYINSIDQYVQDNKNNKLIFGRIFDETGKDSAPEWRLFLSDKTLNEADDYLYEIAYLWIKDQKIVYVSYLFTSPSGDWNHYVDYYYRDDGSIIKTESSLRTFYGDVIINKNSYFNINGHVVRSMQEVLDIKTEKPIEIEKERSFQDRDIKVFYNVSDLPFVDLIK